MTTGNTGMVWKIGPFGGQQYGVWHNRQWSGGDSVTTTNTRASYASIISNLRDLGIRADGTRSELTRLHQEIADLKAEAPPRKRTPEQQAELAKLRLRRDTAHRLLQMESETSKWLKGRKRETAAQLRVEKLRKRALPPNPYWCYVQDVSNPGLTYWGGIFAAGYGNYFSPTLPSWNIADPSAKFKLIGKLREKVYGSGFNPFVFAGEGRKTITMIGDAAKDLASALRAVRRGDVNSFLRAIRGSRDEKRIRNAFSHDVASRHLAVMYGVRPLLNDMEGGAKFIAQAVHGSDPTGQRVVARTSYVQERTMPERQGTAWWSRQRVLVRHQLICYVTDTRNGFLPSIPDLASVAWELTPFSFLVDWLLPVGKYIDALRLQNDVKGTWVETVTAHAYCLDGKTWDALGPDIWTQLPNEAGHYEMFMNRTVTENLVLPSLGALVSDLKASEVLNWTRTSNLLALAVQEAKRYKG